MQDQDVDVVKKICLYVLSDQKHRMQLLIFSKLEKQLLSLLYNSSIFSGLIKLSWFYEQIKGDHSSALPLDNIIVEIHQNLTAHQRSLLLDFIRAFNAIIERKQFDTLERLDQDLLLPLSSSYKQFFITLDQQIASNTHSASIFYVYMALMFIRLQKYFISQNWYCFGTDIDRVNGCFESLIDKINSIVQLCILPSQTPRILKLLQRANNLYLKHYLPRIKYKGYNYPDINLGIVTLKLALSTIII